MDLQEININNLFVPYEQALALKELGFDESCLVYYDNSRLFLIDRNSKIIPKNSIYSNNELYRGIISVPTFSQAFKFFRDKYKMDSVILRTFCMTNSYHYRIVINNSEDNVIDAFVKSDRTYEEAELECLNKLIEIVKTKKICKTYI